MEDIALKRWETVMPKNFFLRNIPILTLTIIALEE